MGWLANYRKRNTESREKILRAVTFGEPAKGQTTAAPAPPKPPKPPTPPRPPRPPRPAWSESLHVGMQADMDAFNADMEKLTADLDATMRSAFSAPGLQISALGDGYAWESTTVRVTVGGSTVELEDPYRCHHCDARQPITDGVFLVGGEPVCQKCHDEAPKVLGAKQAEQEPLLPAEEIVDDLAKLRDELS